MFGWTGTLNIALSFSLVGGIQEDKSIGLDHGLFWKRSLATAVACRTLGEVTGYSLREELFLPGLLQDIGMLAIDKAEPQVYADIGDRQQDHKYVCVLEKQKIGADHAAVGQWLLKSWRIPEKITRLIALSHGDEVEGHEPPGPRRAHTWMAWATWVRLPATTQRMRSNRSPGES